ncbi:hypothetical protein FQN54_007786 [Arachnomyces sp. PD_36]|nr:hypothetical protein FQN54_007786 [Arachnomyces sp. PD_36]
MPQIEVLPNSSTGATPGWAYVPATRFDPSKAAIKPSGVRKRGARDTGTGGGRADVTSRQNTAILRHLAELDRENHRDVHIPIPAKKQESRGTRGKITSNVRRILMSQKTFRNYLDDEEAALAQGQPTPSTQRPSNAKAAKPVPGATTTSSTLSTPQPATTTTSTTPTQPEQSQSQPQGLITSEFDNDPLLRSYIPSAPSERIMQALLSEPPLSYNASRAGPPTVEGSGTSRQFCSICGYWGGIRCRKCHSRTCGLDCYKVHEETRCDRFYA